MNTTGESNYISTASPSTKGIRMSHVFVLSLASALFLCAAVTAQENTAKPPATKPVVVMTTSMGTMEITLEPAKAPESVKNFLSYVAEGFYDSTIFHRVISGFMIQGGGMTVTMAHKPTRDPIKNEAANGLSNKRGTIAMATSPNAINSGTCQFFINHVDNAALDHKDNTLQGFGYAVFGQVTKGLDVVDAIAKVPTGPGDVPRKPVVIVSVKLKN
jgi:cyclophilin family peptidyl-prolyl cis-trans isomerase